MSYLGLVVAGRLHARLGVTDLLQHDSALLQVLGKGILLLRDLREEDRELVADVAEALVLCRLAPLAQLAGDTLALAASSLVCADDMVFRLDELVQLL